MNPDILPLLFATGKYVLATVVLYLFYRLIYRKHASYRESRLFLLSITLMAVLVSQFRVEVTKPAPVYVQVTPTLSGIPISATPVQAETPRQSTSTATPIVQPSPSLPVAVPTSTESVLVRLEHYFTANLGFITLVIYFLVAFLLLLNLLYQYARIGRLRRTGNPEARDGYTLVRRAGVDTPFSSGKTIFLPNNLSDNQQDVVLQHERWHIRHRHYLDVYLQEVLSCLCWFNPIQWILRKELRSIHEFEADRSVLSEGTDLYRYQTIILEEVMGNHFRLANGFNQSFTKKRFIQMKNTQNNRLAPSHKLLLVPVLTLLFAALSFVPGQSQVIKVETRTNSSTHQPSTITTTSTFTMDTVRPNSLINLDPTRINDPGYLQTSYLKSLDSMQQMVNKSLPVVRKLAAQTNPSANTADMNALLVAMDIKANNQGISITDLSPEVRKSFTRDDFKQLQKVLENTNDSLRLYRMQKVDRMDSPYLLRPVGLAQQLMTSNFVSKLLPELFTVMSKQLSGMMQGMTSSFSPNPAVADHNRKDANDAGKMMGDMMSQLTKSLGQITNTITQPQPSAAVVCDTVRTERTIHSTPDDQDAPFHITVVDEKPIDQTALIYVAMNDRDPNVRLASLKQLTDQATLSYVAMNDRDSRICIAAIEKLTDFSTLNYVAMNGKEANTRLAAVNRINELNQHKKAH